MSNRIDPQGGVAGVSPSKIWRGIVICTVQRLDILYTDHGNDI
jgi:hypothetical protein